MNRRQFVSTALSCGIGGSLFAMNRLFQPTEVSPPARRGINLAGAEFGTDKMSFCNRYPGIFNRDYTWNSEPTVRYFCDQGIQLFRIPFRWERIQPELGASLHPQELERLHRLIGWIGKHGGQAILDIHNYGRYVLVHQDRIRECIIDESVGDTVPVSRHHFCDLWSRLSQEFRHNKVVFAYGLMNEPHDMGYVDWQGISQAAVDGIRSLGDGKRILIAGDNWSHANGFAKINGPTAWIKDSLNNHAYEAHCYLDWDHSGTYQLSYDDEQRRDRQFPNRIQNRLLPFIEWCQHNRVIGFLGEFGIPGHEPRWVPMLSEMLTQLDLANIECCYWAAGEWWGDYPLSIQPAKKGSTKPQLEVLRRA